MRLKIALAPERIDPYRALNKRCCARYRTCSNPELLQINSENPDNQVPPSCKVQHPILFELHGTSRRWCLAC